MRSGNSVDFGWEAPNCGEAYKTDLQIVKDSVEGRASVKPIGFMLGSGRVGTVEPARPPVRSILYPELIKGRFGPPTSRTNPGHRSAHPGNSPKREQIKPQDDGFQARQVFPAMVFVCAILSPIQRTLILPRSALRRNSAYEETPSGNSYVQSTIATGLNFPTGVTVDSKGNIYIANAYSNKILMGVPGFGRRIHAVDLCHRPPELPL